MTTEKTPRAAAKATPRAKKAEPKNAIVLIDFGHFLLPYDDGLKLLAAMKNAVMVEHCFGDSDYDFKPATRDFALSMEIDNGKRVKK